MPPQKVRPKTSKKTRVLLTTVQKIKKIQKTSLQSLEKGV
jgi:hypothetical protein